MDKSDKPFDRVAYQNEYNKKNYDRITIMVPKGRHDELRKLAKSSGVSVNKYVLAAIEFYSNKEGKL